MKCTVCACLEGPCKNKKMKTRSFYVHLRSSFKDHTTLPCFATKELNHRRTASAMYVETPGREYYKFKLKKKSNRTQIYGSDYRMFLSQYGMKYADIMKFTLNKNVKSDAWILMQPKDSDGFPKDRVREDYVLEGKATVVVFSKGVNPTNSQIGRINKHVTNCGIGLGFVFVHSLTPTDKNYLRIPKEISSYLDVPRRGYAVMNEDNLHKEIGYYMTKDRRLCFKSGWKQFAAEAALEDGLDVLVLFHKIK